MGFLRRLFGEQDQATTVRFDAVVLRPARIDAALDIVGEASYQRALEEIGGGKGPDGPGSPDHMAVLWPEPKNRYDHNAIAIKIAGSTVGYLSREDAIRYHVVTDLAGARGQMVGCEAYLTGGWDRGRGDSGSIGVRLHLGSPGECMLELLGDGLTVSREHGWAGQLVAFTGDSRCSVGGFVLDREVSVTLATRAGLDVHPRITKKVQLLVDCDPDDLSGNERKANVYGIPVVTELEFWRALGLAAEPTSWRPARPTWQQRSR